MLDLAADTTALPGAGRLSRQADSTLTEQLAARFAERIRARLLAPGARLPSVRECARRHEVSPTTVVAAYDQLLAQGLVEARAQRGFYVRAPLGEAPVGAARATPLPRSPVPISATTLIRGMFQPPGAQPMPGLGTLPAEWLDPSLLAGAMRKVSAQLGRTALLYGEPAGEQRLRRVLATRLSDHGIAATAEQIVTTVGATHALDVVTRTLLKPGDTVLVDEPGWSIEYARLAALGLHVLPVPRGPEGPDLAAMQRLIEAQPAGAKPRLYVTVSVLHNPTGASISLQSAHKVLQLAQLHDFAIVEDDTYAHLAPPHLPRLAALDALERTIYVSGFSKILTPSWRVGYIAAPARLVDRLIDTKLLSTLTTPSMTELALAHCLEQGLLRRHAERVQRLLDAARGRVVELARAHGCRFVAEPRGLFGWVDVGVDTERLAQLMHDDGWLIAPGALFHATHRPTRLMRINFATTQEARFWQALQHARSSLRPLS
ncbi:PLP-dependent aminotransferase family protein [uncultured Piscinibacter sp.]|uniref:aminotransferase-like domain-containing protein n=1 Tax=uncultured Piscinibacter sp. TaxID=1131835 RepID=UPI00261621B9|nr:PLP-dependent aminotransferase family protein [uncultured Piscinibacter sp.]